MRNYRKAAISYVIIFICALLIFFTASKITSSGNLNYLSIEYWILIIFPMIIIFSASLMRKIIDDLIPKEKR